MTISSSLNAGVTGLNVNASRLATISDNIANSATHGYKRATADFHSLVLGQSRGAYAAGGVRVTTGRAVDQNGTLSTTNNPTDLAIGGRGMLPVTSVAAVSSGRELPLRLTSTGSFRADANGILRTASGQALLGWPANQAGVVPSFPRDSASALVPVKINANEFEGDATTRISLDVNLPATDTAAGATYAPRFIPVEYFGNLGQSETLDFTFTPQPPVAPATSSNAWRLEIADQASGGANVGTFDVQFDQTRPAGGTIASVTPVAPTAPTAYDAATGLLTIDVLGGPVEVYVGMPNDTRGLSQLSNTFAPSVGKNGSPVGILSSIDVDSRGMLTAIYDTGFTKTLYQIPVVDVPNANGLRPLSNQAYQVSRESGPFYLWDAGSGPVGEMVGYAREESTTDVAQELTQLIQTQRAYSSNAKVIQTVDEMLQETTNIKR